MKKIATSFAVAAVALATVVGTASLAAADSGSGSKTCASTNHPVLKVVSAVGSGSTQQIVNWSGPGGTLSSGWVTSTNFTYAYKNGYASGSWTAQSTTTFLSGYPAASCAKDAI